VKWVARGSAYQIVVTGDSVTTRIQEKTGEYGTLQMKLAGSRSWKNVTGLDPTGGVTNYFLGNDPKMWREDIPQYARIRVAGVYDGIDLVLYNSENNLEYDFVVAPGADPGQIQLAFEGQKSMRLDEESGDLVLTTRGGSEVRQKRPRVHQQTGETRVEVSGEYWILDGGQAEFKLASYDRKQALVIDPTEIFERRWSTGSRDDANGIAVDSSGNMYITGLTEDSNFLGGCALQSATCKVPRNVDLAQPDQPGTDAFVLALTPQGTVQWVTYVGGNDYDAAFGIATDSTGLYITGTTASTNFPHAPSKRADDRDVFVTKMRFSDGAILYSTLVGGTSLDVGNAIAVDPLTHFAYVTGMTDSRDFPNDYHFAGSLDDAYYGPTGDVFVFYLDAAGTRFASVRMPANGVDSGTGIALDSDGNIWLAGKTCSSNFPIAGPAAPASVGVSGQYPGKCTGFVAKWQRLISFLLASEYVNGAKAIAVDANKNAFVVGEDDDPTIPSIWLTKFDPTGRGMTRSNTAYPIGSTNVAAYAITLNPEGEVYVVGYWGDNAPKASPGFVAKWTPDLLTELFGMEVGAPGSKFAGVAVWQPSAFTLPRIFIASTFPDGPFYVDYGPANLPWHDPWIYGLIEEPPFVGMAPARLRNFAKQDQYINTQSGTVTSSTIQQGWVSAQWKMIAKSPIAGDPAGATAFWIQSVANPDQYLNVQSGKLQSSPIQPNWLSARWTFKALDGSNAYTIRSVAQPTWTLNLSTGVLAAGPETSTSMVVSTGGGAGEGRPSSAWELEPIYAPVAPPASTTSGPPVSGPPVSGPTGGPVAQPAPPPPPPVKSPPPPKPPQPGRPPVLER
jgi:hypothetical protein